MQKIRKCAAYVLAFCMLCGIFTGCGNKNNSGNVTETQASSAATGSENESDTDEINIFGEGYDPLSDGYDPYGGAANNASAEKITAETIALSDEPDEKTSQDTQQNNSSSQSVDSQKTNDDTKPIETQTAEKQTSDGVSFSVNASNSWESGSDKFVQVDGVVKNSGSKTVSSWTAEINVSASASIEQSWNCDISLNKGKLTVKPVDFNKEIQPNGEATFGVIFKNAGSIGKTSVTCNNSSSEGNVSSGSSSGSSSQNNSAAQSGSVGNNNPQIYQAKDVPAPTTDDWLYVKGNKIVDKNGKEVWLTGVNWFGYNTGTNTFDGLWSCDLNSSLAAIADRGFNLLRVPISTELIKQWSNGEYPQANFNQATNSYLVGMNSLEIFDYVIGQCRANGIKIMIDIHCAKTDSMGHMKNMWYDGNISEKDYLDTLEWIAARYSKDDTIIAYDLENEPHGKANESPRAKWDSSKDADNWKYVAEKAAKAVFKGNPEALVMVEGIEIYPIDTKKNGNFASTNMGDYYCTWWGGNLRGVKDNPIDLGKYQNKLVYAPHDYGPAVYQQPWFQGNYTYDSLYKDCWHDNWLYITEDNIAPLLIGEWGGYMTEPNLTWMTYMRKLIKQYKLNHTFWCFNSNSGDTGGLVKDDFKTWDEEKYNFVKEVLWQQNGHFVGLDHEIPLGSNGITLSEAK